MSARSQITFPKAAVAMMLSLAAGQVDVVGFISCWHVFTSHVTGDTVHFAMSVVQHHWTDALKSGAVIPTFLLGSIVGRSLIEFSVRRQWRRAASFVLLLEAALLSEAIASMTSRHSQSAVWMCLLMLAFSMGLQTAVLTRIGPLTVHTSFVTGMLNSLAQRVSILLFWIVDRLRGRIRTPLAHSVALRQAGLLTAIFLSYASGALLAAIFARRSLAIALIGSVGLLFCSVIVDHVKPLSIEEEEDEAKQEQEEHRQRLAS